MEQGGELLQLSVNLSAADVADRGVHVRLDLFEVGQGDDPAERAELSGSALDGDVHLVRQRAPAGDRISGPRTTSTSEGGVDVAVVDACRDKSGVLGVVELRRKVDVITVSNAGDV